MMFNHINILKYLEKYIHIYRSIWAKQFINYIISFVSFSFHLKIKIQIQKQKLILYPMHYHAVQLNRLHN